MTTNRTRAQASLQFENEKVIVTKWTFSKGAETGWHKHAHDYIVIPNMKGKLLLESSEGESVAELSLGESYYRSAGVEHNVVNCNEFEFSFVEIELK